MGIDVRSSEDNARRAIVRVSPPVLLMLGQRTGTATQNAPIPAGSTLVKSWIDERGDLLMLVESDAFGMVAEGQRYPELVGIQLKAPANAGAVPTAFSTVARSRQETYASLDELDLRG